MHKPFALYNSVRIAKIVGIILLLALIANLTIKGWDWGTEDFIVMGAMLFVAGTALDVVARKISKPIYRITAILLVVVAFLLVWAELAVDAVSKIIENLFF